MKSKLQISLVVLLLTVTTPSLAQIPVESGSAGNLLTVVLFNSDDLIALEATVEYTSLPSFVTFWTAELDRVLPDPTPPLAFGCAQFIFDVDDTTPLGTIGTIEFDIIRNELTTTTVTVDLELVPAAVLAADVRVVFTADMTDTGAVGGDTVEAILDDGTSVSLNDAGTAPDASAGDGLWTGDHTFTMGSVAQRRYGLFHNGVAECDSSQAPEQRIFRVEDLLYDDTTNPQILPTAEFGLCTVVALPVTATSIALQANRPNPFQALTTFAWSQNRTARVSLAMYDARGRRVALPLPPTEYPAGQHSLPWDARSQDGGRLAAGVYHLRLTIDGSEAQTRSILLVR